MGCSDEIFDFLLKQHSEKEVEPLILCIAVYADPHFANIETFESWWNIENLALGGKKPKVLAQTKSGIEQVITAILVGNTLSILVNKLKTGFMTI